jgi:subtilisin family serine protease
MSVAATDIANQEASFSNFGPCVDIWAPGVNIISTKRISGTATLSGTSMATPHVTGTAALFWAVHRGSTPSDVEAALRAFARPTGTVSKGGTPITLVYEGSF